MGRSHHNGSFFPMLLFFFSRDCIRLIHGLSSLSKLPDYVNLIFLSATTPNTIEFSEWIGRTKRKPVHVIRTNYRPVPLQHNLYAGSKLHCVLEGRSGFNPKGFAEAAKALLPKSAQKAADEKTKSGAKNKAVQPAKLSTKPGQQQGSKQDWLSLARYLEREGLMPTVVFSFSKKKCEEIATMLRSLVGTIYLCVQIF